MSKYHKALKILIVNELLSTDIKNDFSPIFDSIDEGMDGLIEDTELENAFNLYCKRSGKVDEII